MSMNKGTDAAISYLKMEQNSTGLPKTQATELSGISHMKFYDANLHNNSLTSSKEMESIDYEPDGSKALKF